MIWNAFYAPIVDPTHQRVTRIYPWDDLVCMYGLQGGMFRLNNNNNPPKPCRCLEDGGRPARRSTPVSGQTLAGRIQRGPPTSRCSPFCIFITQSLPASHPNSGTVPFHALVYLA